MGMAAMLVMWPRPFEQLFFPKGPKGCIWNLVAIGPVVSEEKSFEIVDGWVTDDGACLYYKLPRSLRLRWAKKDKQNCMWHSVLTCSIILPSMIKIFLMVTELCSGNDNEVKYGSGDIIRKRRYAELSFLYATLSVDLFYNPTKSC